MGKITILLLIYTVSIWKVRPMVRKDGVIKKNTHHFYLSSLYIWFDKLLSEIYL